MRAYSPLLVVLASIWGASYLFIKVAVEDMLRLQGSRRSREAV